MKKRFLSIMLCFCMVLGLLPANALATDDPDFSGLTEGETVTIDNIDYIYNGEADTSGIQMYSGDGMSYDALTEAYCWKAGSGYVLYNPTVESGKTTSAEVTLHNATISTESATALDLPITGTMEDGAFPVPVTIYVEGANSLATSDAAKYALYNGGSNSTFITGGGTLSLTNSASDGFYSSIVATVVTIDSGTQITVSGGSENTIEDITVTGSDSKMTIVNGTVLKVIKTCMVENGAVLENNGKLNMMYKTTDEPGITGEISGNGGIVFQNESETVYCLVGGEFIPYGGDISVNGLNISGKDASGNEDATYNAPTVVTGYKAGDGYALFTPQAGGANAKLEFHDATIATTNATALTLPSTEPVDITVIGDNSLTAGGSGNVIAANGQALSVTGSGNLTLAGPYYGVNVNGGGAVSISIDGNMTFDTVYQPISTSGDITVSAKNITSKSGYYFYSGGTVSLTATDGDIVFDDTGKANKQEKIKGTNGITVNAPNGKIDIISGGGGCYALNSSSGIITVTALNDVIINASCGGSINSGKSDTSDVVLVNSSNGSIQMSCGDSYECVQSSGGVALTAAEDITLNGTEQSTAAIKASSKNVSITAGGKLTSTTAYGFQVGTLNIQANEVSIAGTSQSGIQASSVSISNTDGTNNCKSVSVTATSNSGWAAIDSSNVTIKADDVLVCGNSSAKAINAQNSAGTVTIGDAGMIIGAVSISGTNAINPNILCIESSGADASTGLDLSAPPSVITYYEAGDGYALFTPANGEAKATLTLHNASINSSSATPLELGAETVIKLEGTNSLTNSNTDSGVGIRAISSTTGECQSVTIQGDSDDSLTVSAYQCTNIGTLTVDGGSVTMNGGCYGILAKGNVILKNGAKVSASGGDMGGAVDLEDMSETEQYSLTVSDGSTLTVNKGDAGITGYFTVNGSGSKVTTNSGVKTIVLGAVKVENSGVLENNGIWQMKMGTTVEDIKALKLTGSGVVRVVTKAGTPSSEAEWDTYTNEGVPVKEISDDLDLTTGDDSGDLTTDGYTWDDSISTLTLGNAVVTGTLTVPDNTIINTTSGSTIMGTITGVGGTDLTFTGTAPLTINGSINGGDGTLNVTGSSTVLNLSSSDGFGALYDEVNVGNGATLQVGSQGDGSRGIQAHDVNVTGGATLRAGCDYGVYIIDGKLTVESGSKLITNGEVAPFCVVDTTSSKDEEDVIALPGLPSGTKITSKLGNEVGFGYTYWSLVSTNGSLSVTDEDPSPAILEGAVKGLLTFQKAKKSSSGGSGGASVTRTLTFDTNGGSDISSVSKTSGAVVDLKDYKPTREGYTFAGWYSDKALTKKITSETLTASTTVYAKWIENAGETAEPEETKETKKAFTDVKDSDYYYDAVQWAVENNITSGTTSTTFGSSDICTRAQIVTFLWKAMGSPEPTAENCAFNDVSKDAYYYKAVLWAVENNITAGATVTTFEPNATVTRGQTGTFLWRGAGKPTAAIANPYTDVAKGGYNYDAILWAAENGITQGTSTTTFSPDAPCTRGQIVTFLYKLMKK